IPMIEHIPWQQKNIRVPPALLPKVLKALQDKLNVGIYETSQSSYQSHWFCVLKKDGSLHPVLDLQPLNGITIWDSTLPLLSEPLVKSYGRQSVYTLFNFFQGFKQHLLHPES
ncbi:hypothetical protein DACRYDRAFT_26045, partial [Dacryopinax primogenitus]